MQGQQVPAKVGHPIHQMHFHQQHMRGVPVPGMAMMQPPHQHGLPTLPGLFPMEHHHNPHMVPLEPLPSLPSLPSLSGPNQPGMTQHQYQQQQHMRHQQQQAAVAQQQHNNAMMAAQQAAAAANLAAQQGKPANANEAAVAAVTAAQARAAADPVPRGQQPLSGTKANPVPNMQQGAPPSVGVGVNVGVNMGGPVPVPHPMNVGVGMYNVGPPHPSQLPPGHIPGHQGMGPGPQGVPGQPSLGGPPQIQGQPKSGPPGVGVGPLGLGVGGKQLTEEEKKVNQAALAAQMYQQVPQQVPVGGYNPMFPMPQPMMPPPDMSGGHGQPEEEKIRKKRNSKTQCRCGSLSHHRANHKDCPYNQKAIKRRQVESAELLPLYAVPASVAAGHPPPTASSAAVSQSVSGATSSGQPPGAGGMGPMGGMGAAAVQAAVNAATQAGNNGMGSMMPGVGAGQNPVAGQQVGVGVPQQVVNMGPGFPMPLGNLAGMIGGIGVSQINVNGLMPGVGLQLAAQPAAPPVTPRRMCRCGATNHARSSSKLCPFFGTGLQSATKTASASKQQQQQPNPMGMLGSPGPMGMMPPQPNLSPPNIVGTSMVGVPMSSMTGIPNGSSGLSMGGIGIAVQSPLTGSSSMISSSVSSTSGVSESTSSPATSSVSSSSTSVASSTAGASVVTARTGVATAAAPVTGTSGAMTSTTATAPSVSSSSSSSSSSTTTATSSVSGSTASSVSSASSSSSNSKGKKRRFPRTYQAEEVARDARGKPIMPIRISPQSEGGLTIRSLGKVDTRKGWHSSRYIWPIGFKTERLYPSMVVPGTRVKYTCEIVEREQRPWFQLQAWDAKDKPVGDVTPSGAWSRVLGFVRALNNKPQEIIDENGRRIVKPVTLGSRVSGAHKFGFSMPTVARLIQELPDADKLQGYPAYKMKNFVVSNPSYNSASAPASGEASSPNNMSGGIGSGSSSGTGKKRHKGDSSGPGPMSVGGVTSPAVINAAASAVAAAAQRAASEGGLHHSSLVGLPLGPIITGIAPSSSSSTTAMTSSTSSSTSSSTAPAVVPIPTTVVGSGMTAGTPSSSTLTSTVSTLPRLSMTSQQIAVAAAASAAAAAAAQQAAAGTNSATITRPLQSLITSTPPSSSSIAPITSPTTDQSTIVAASSTASSSTTTNVTATPAVLSSSSSSSSAISTSTSSSPSPPPPSSSSVPAATPTITGTGTSTSTGVPLLPIATGGPPVLPALPSLSTTS